MSVRPPDALMYRFHADKVMFCWPPAFRIPYYRRRGWMLLIDEPSIRQADIEETRQADENKPINRPRWEGPWSNGD